VRIGVGQIAGGSPAGILARAIEQGAAELDFRTLYRTY